jgi:hypothetical protein
MARRPKTPASTVYQSRMPTGGLAVKSVKRASENQPSARRGRPRSRLPSAAPNKTGSRALAAQNRKSHHVRQSGSSRWLRNSMETPRRMSVHRTRKMAK